MFRPICSHNQAQCENKNKQKMSTAAREVGDEHFLLIFSFRDEHDDGYILAEIYSRLYLINTSCVTLCIWYFSLRCKRYRDEAPSEKKRLRIECYRPQIKMCARNNQAGHVRLCCSRSILNQYLGLTRPTQLVPPHLFIHGLREFQFPMRLVFSAFGPQDDERKSRGKVFALLGCYAVLIGSLLLTFRDSSL